LTPASQGAATVVGVLAEMRIQGLGVIEEAALELHPGFTVVTGETGAGKTMVVTGLHLLSGGRSDATKVRAGAAKAIVEGRFTDVTGEQALRILSDAGADTDEDGSVIALRSVGADGRSRAHLGGRSVPVGVLGHLSEQLLAVHGQNDQLRLLRPAEQRAVLDRFAGESVAKPLAAYREVRREWLAVSRELTERRARSRELAQQADLLRHGLAEIEAVEPTPGEDAELTEQVKRLAAVDELRDAATAAQLAVAGSPDGDPDVPGALGLLAEARRRLSTAEDAVLRDFEPRLAEASARTHRVPRRTGRRPGTARTDPGAAGGAQEADPQVCGRHRRRAGVGGGRSCATRRDGYVRGGVGGVGRAAECPGRRAEDACAPRVGGAPGRCRGARRTHHG
jgi:DNA repair protein RecN (Recombination protein N)